MPVVEFLQFTLSGVSFGMIYAAVALSLVLIWRGTRLLNYAQGGMAMITTYVAIEVVYRTGSYWAGFRVALAGGPVLRARLRRRARRRRRPRRALPGHHHPADHEQATAQRGDRDHRIAHPARGAGRRLLRRPVPVFPDGVLGERAEN